MKCLKILCSETAENHQKLYQYFPINPNPQSVKFSSSQLEDIQAIFTSLKSLDLSLNDYFKTKNIHSVISDLHKNLKGIKLLLHDNIKKVKNEVLSISTILKEFKSRCQNTFIDFLKTLDLDLRRALKPLVPVKVLQEQLKYKPINPECLLSSLRSVPQEEDKPLNSTVDKLNNHIQLLISTLEAVAKDLISITQNTSQKFYEITDPLSLYSEPPSPLAAPLPDYFSYDLASLTQQEAEYKRAGLQLSEHTKKKILSKLKSIISGTDKSCDPESAVRVSEKLSKLFMLNIEEIDLLGYLKEEGVPISEREKIVFDIINTERSSGLDVNIEDMILAEEKEKRDHLFEVSHNDYSDVLKNIEGKDLTDRLEDRSQFGSLQSSIDEKFIKEITRKTTEKKPFVPVLLKNDKVRSKSKLSLNNIKMKNSTPSKPQKIQPKRAHTPGLKKKKKNN